MRGEVVVSGVRSGAGRIFSCAASSSCSAMAGACSDPPPMYRANVGVCLINDKNQVSVFLEPVPLCYNLFGYFFRAGVSFLCDTKL